jgi:hypothetical protein
LAYTGRLRGSLQQLAWAACVALSLGEENMSFPYTIPDRNQRYTLVPNC